VHGALARRGGEPLTERSTPGCATRAPWSRCRRPFLIAATAPWWNRMTREQGVPSAGTRSCSGRVEAGRALCYAGRPMDSIKIEQLVKDRDFDLRLELLAGENGLDRRVVARASRSPGSRSAASPSTSTRTACKSRKHRDQLPGHAPA